MSRSALSVLLTLTAFAQERPVYVVEQRLVNVTFAVTDTRGAFQAGLDRRDFDVFEDGEQREIAAFSRGTISP